MKNWLHELLSEGGNVSTMRVMSLLCVLTSCIISIVAIIIHAELMGTSILVGALLTPAFTGKIMQKSKETEGAAHGPDTAK